MKLLLLLPVAAAAALLSLLGISVLSGSDQNVLPAALIGRPAPVAVLEPPPGYGPGVDTGALTGQVTLVNFFASWCAPCLAEHPLLSNLAARDDVVLVGIANRDRAEDTAAWLDRNGNPYDAIGLDPENRVGLEWGAYGVPETYLVGPDGIIRYRHVGQLTPAAIADALDPLIGELQP